MCSLRVNRWVPLGRDIVWICSNDIFMDGYLPIMRKQYNCQSGPSSIDFDVSAHHNIAPQHISDTNEWTLSAFLRFNYYLIWLFLYLNSSHIVSLLCILYLFASVECTVTGCLPFNHFSVSVFFRNLYNLRRIERANTVDIWSIHASLGHVCTFRLFHVAGCSFEWASLATVCKKDAVLRWLSLSDSPWKDKECSKHSQIDLHVIYRYARAYIN